MKKRNLLDLLGVIVFLAFSSLAHADSIDVTLQQSSLTATPGSTVTFDATLTNPSSTDTIFLNSDSFATTSLLLSVDDTPYFNNAPLFLDPGASSGLIPLFSVIIDPTTSSGTYDFNSFSILGGADSSASGTLGTAEFSVTVASAVPEPGSLVLCLSGLVGLGLRKRVLG